MTRHSKISSLPPPDGPAGSSMVVAVPSHRYSARQIWQIIRRHELLLGAIVFTTVLAVLISQWSETPTYKATAVIQVELNDEKGLPDAAARNKERVANEAGLYESRSLAERVVRDLGLTHDPRFTDRPLPRSRAAEPKHVMGATGTLLSMTSVAPEKASDFIAVSVVSPSAELASEIANQYALSLSSLRTEIRDERRNEVVRDLEQQRSRLAIEARQAEQALANFRRTHQMLTGAGGEEDYQQINRIAIEAASANAMRAAQNAIAGGVSFAASQRSTAGATSALLDQQQRRLDELMRERSDLSVTLGSRHPRVQSVDAQIAETRSNLSHEEANVIAAANARVGAEAARERALAGSEAAAASARAGQLQSQLRSMTSKAYANTANMVTLNALERQAEAAREAFLATAKRSQEVQSGIDAEGIHSTLVSPAAAPREPISPRPKSATFAAFTGSLLLGLLIIMAIELTDNRLWNAEQVARLFGLPTFAMIPELGKGAIVSADDNPVLQDPQSLFAEVARGLSAEVADLARDDRTQTVLITSPVIGDGKSTVALTLAAAAALAGRRAVLLDLDLRRPSGDILKTMQTQGASSDLVDYLSGTADVGKLLPTLVAVDNVQDDEAYQPVILSAREPTFNPAVLMRHGRINRLLDELRKQYDLIVINAPAALATSDARMLTDAVDNTLLVARWGRTTTEQVHATMQILQDEVDGVVINRVDYVEHARRGYGDSVQFYMDSAGYYSGAVPTRPTWSERFANLWQRSSSDAA